MALMGIRKPRHGLSITVISNQNHLMRKAWFSMGRLRTPSPPYGFGVQTIFHATMQQPPLASSTPFQKNRLLSLSMHLKNQAGRSSAIMCKMGMAESLQLTSVSRPARLAVLYFALACAGHKLKVWWAVT